MYTSLGKSVSEVTTKFGQCSTRAEAEDNSGLPGCGITGKNRKAFCHFRVSQSVATDSQVGTVTEKTTQPTTLAMREVNAQKPVTEERPQAHDGRSKRDKLNHDGCEYGGIHTDACWNDPRWDESNETCEARLADRIAFGCYSLQERKQAEIFDGKYRSACCCYHDQLVNHSYCNFKITRCSDGKTLVDMNKTGSLPLWDFFRRNGEDWFVIFTGSPVLINLTTEKTFKQRGDHFYPDDLAWHSVEVSPDGNTLLATGNVNENDYHGHVVIQFFDFSHPEQGFRQLTTDWLEEPDWGDEDPEWDTDQDNNTTVTLVKALDSDDDEISCDDNGFLFASRKYLPPGHRVTLRREGNQMVEIRRELVKARTPVGGSLPPSTQSHASPASGE